MCGQDEAANGHGQSGRRAPRSSMGRTFIGGSELGIVVVARRPEQIAVEMMAESANSCIVDKDSFVLAGWRTSGFRVAYCLWSLEFSSARGPYYNRGHRRCHLPCPLLGSGQRKAGEKEVDEFRWLILFLQHPVGVVY